MTVSANKRILQVLPAFLLALVYLGSCSGGQQQQQGSEFENSQEGGEYENGGNYENGGENAGENFTNEGANAGYENGYEEQGEGDDYGNDYGEDSNLTENDTQYAQGENAGDNYGEQVNNAADAEMFTNAELTENSLTDGEALNNSYDGDELAADAQLVNNATATDEYMNPAAGQSANVVPDMVAPSGPSTPPPPGGIVKYILGETTLLDGPGGSPIKTLMRGDHPVVYDMGEYHQTMDGQYIPSTSLTTSPVGRTRVRGYWR